VALGCLRDGGLALQQAHSGRCHVPLGTDRKVGLREPESSHLCFFAISATVKSCVAALHVQSGPRNSIDGFGPLVLGWLKAIDEEELDGQCPAQLLAMPPTSEVVILK